jgi:hypothetical protein
MFTQHLVTKLLLHIEWEKDTEYHEAYDKWAGHYTQVVEVARPTSFVDHTFTFERPYLKNAIDLLIMRDRVHEAIQAYRKSRTKSDA